MFCVKIWNDLFQLKYTSDFSKTQNSILELFRKIFEKCGKFENLQCFSAIRNVCGMSIEIDIGFLPDMKNKFYFIYFEKHQELRNKIRSICVF